MDPARYFNEYRKQSNNLSNEIYEILTIMGGLENNKSNEKHLQNLSKELLNLNKKRYQTMLGLAKAYEEFSKIQKEPILERVLYSISEEIKEFAENQTKDGISMANNLRLKIKSLDSKLDKEGNN